MSQQRERKPTESPRSRLILLFFALLLVFGILAYAVVVTNAERIMSVLLQENDEIERPFCIHDYGLQIEVDGKQLRGVASFLSCLDYGVVTGSQGAKGAYDTAMETRFVVLLKHHLLEESYGPSTSSLLLPKGNEDNFRGTEVTWSPDKSPELRIAYRLDEGGNEILEFNNREFTFDKGHLFLVDATVSPPVIQQIDKPIDPSPWYPDEPYHATHYFEERIRESAGRYPEANGFLPFDELLYKPR